jgi:hypothetical protein
MAKPRSGFLSALGVLFQVFKALADDVLAVGGDDEDIRRIQTDHDLRKQIVKLIMLSRQGALRQLEAWKVFYKKFFNIEIDAFVTRIPEHQSDFNRLIVVAKGLTLNQVYGVCAKHFPCWRWTEDLDKAVDQNDRDPKNGAYIIWVRDRQEADEELKNLSADQLKEKDIPCITLLERCLLEFFYWDETGGKHLETSSITICAGSHSDSGVPGTGDPDGSSLFKICSYFSDGSGGGLRARSVVS